MVARFCRTAVITLISGFLVTAPRAAIASPTSALTTCQSNLAFLRKEVPLTEALLFGRRPAQELFEVGTTNIEAAQELAPTLKTLFAGLGISGLEHALECRTHACRLIVRMPALPKNKNRSPFDWSSVRQSKAWTERFGNGALTESEPQKHPVSGQRIWQDVAYFVLKSPKGHGVSLPLEAAVQENTPRLTDPSPRDLPACQTAVSELVARAEKVRLQREARLPINMIFARAAADRNQSLETKVLADAAGALPKDLVGKLGVACRGRVCLFKGLPQSIETSVLSKLRERSPFRENLERLDFFYRDAPVAATAPEGAFALFRERPHAFSLDLLDAFAKATFESTAAAECLAQHPSRGFLRVKYSIPSTEQRDSSGGKLVLRFTDELAGTALAQCMELAIRKQFLKVSLPPDPIQGAVTWRTFEFGELPKI